MTPEPNIVYWVDGEGPAILIGPRTIGNGGFFAQTPDGFWIVVHEEQLRGRASLDDIARFAGKDPIKRKKWLDAVHDARLRRLSEWTKKAE